MFTQKNFTALHTRASPCFSKELHRALTKSFTVLFQRAWMPYQRSIQETLVSIITRVAPVSCGRQTTTEASSASMNAGHWKESSAFLSASMAKNTRPASFRLTFVSLQDAHTTTLKLLDQTQLVLANELVDQSRKLKIFSTLQLCAVSKQ